MSTEPVSLDLDRRSFMKASALAGGVALVGSGVGQTLSQNDGEADGQDTEGELTKTVCNFCAVGCGFRGERKGNAFVGQEPWHENPINNGSLCSKGAAIYGSEHSERRLKHPMIKRPGESGWQKTSWNNAYDLLEDEITRVWEEHSRESVMLLGSAHWANEEAYASRKLAAFMGTNNIDHQARICHSTTVAGLANTWGYGAMTNTVNDYRNFDLNIIIGQNPAEAHPIAMQHILEGQKRGGTVVTVDARYTKTSAHADEFYRIRPGTDVALMMGLIRYLREQGELAMDGDDETGQNMLSDRVQGWADFEAELDNPGNNAGSDLDRPAYDLETVADITWIDEEDIRELGDLIIENKPHVQIEWAMGGTQHNNGTQNIRSYAGLSLASGSAARSGGGLQVMRGHSNVQGATDLAVASHILPGYYPLSPGGWSWWAKVWNQSPYTSGSTSFDDLYEKFELMPEDLFVEQSPTVDDPGSIDTSQPADNSMMFQNGLTVARWFEAALSQEDRLQETPVYQPDDVKIAFYWGHSANSISEMGQMKDGLENIDLLVVVDMFPSVVSVLPDFEEAPPILLLPVASQYEHHRSVTNSHRSVQWSEPVRPPSHNTKPDLQIMQELADRLGFGEHFDWGNGTEMYNGRSTYEDVLREINLGTMTIGYRQDPERLQQHLEYDWAFSSENLRVNEPGLPVSGDYWMLPWPCWGEDHPGTPIIWRDDLDPNDGGQDFRTRWGVQAPTPDEWEQMPTDDPYPFQETVDQEGMEGLNMLREPYEPDWADGTIEGVPEYPGWATTLPDNVQNSDELPIPFEYALDPNESAHSAAQAMNNQKGADFDLNFWQQFDNNQPDPPTGRGRARAVAWSFLDKVPMHREPLESPRPDLVETWPANGQQKNFYRLDQNNAAEQQTAMSALQDFDADDFRNVVMTTGRQVEHQGGGAESRSNIFLADLQPHMYAEIHPEIANQLGVEGGDLIVVETTDRGSVLVKARITNRVNEEETFLPFHWGGVFKGESLEDKYPDGYAPLAIGDSANSITSRGYDVETQMQETKAAMVRLRPATPDVLNDVNIDIETSMLRNEFPQDRAGIGQQKDFDASGDGTVQ
jgi:formate dehydrogenase major subunit